MMTLAGELRPYPSIYWAGYVQDAMKEAAEAAIPLAIVANRRLPEPAELGAEDAAYLNAMAEAASELRGQVLDRLRENDLPRAEYLLGTMDDIYSALVTVDFPDAITGGLRRTTDALRAVLERTRSDLTLTLVQSRLHAALDAHESGLSGGEQPHPDDRRRRAHPALDPPRPRGRGLRRRRGGQRRGGPRGVR